MSSFGQPFFETNVGKKKKIENETKKDKIKYQKEFKIQKEGIKRSKNTIGSHLKWPNLLLKVNQRQDENYSFKDKRKYQKEMQSPERGN